MCKWFKIHKLLSLTCLLAVFVSLTSVLRAGCPDMARYWESQLQARNFSTDTPEQIIEAAKSESYFIRYISLKLLASRINEQAIPVIKEALNDEHVKVRLTAAHLLGTMNDKSGLERMQLDFMELVPGNVAPELSDPNITNDPKELEKWNRNRLYRISKALEVAEVLAELGDRRGYELACKVGLNESLAAIRSRAVKVLGEIAKTKPAILAAERKDPVLALSQRAKVEKRRTVFKKIVMVAEELRGENGLQILEQATRSPYQDSMDIKRVKGSLGKIRNEIKSSPK